MYKCINFHTKWNHDTEEIKLVCTLIYFYKKMTYKNMRLGMSKNKNID